MTRRLLLILIICAVGASCATGETYQEPIAVSRQEITRLMASAAIPGAQIAVTVGDRIVWLESFGESNIQSHDLVRNDTRFRVGSVSKVLTAAALMRLVENGTLRLDDPVSRYLPDFPYGEVTLRQLAGHLGGIRHYSRNEFVNREHFASVTASLARFANDPRLAPPGQVYTYSSYGYNLLGAVIERAGKQRFESLMATTLFRPAGMSDTTFEPSSGRVTGFYGREGGAIVAQPDVDLSDRIPSGGVLTTARDLARFNIGMTARLLTPASRGIMFTRQQTADGKPAPAGIAWRVEKDDAGRTFVHHGGEAMGGRAFVLIYPAERVSVAFVCNLSFAPFNEKNAGEIARRFIGNNSK